MSPMQKVPLALEHALLGMLREAPMHPYEMHQQLLQGDAIGQIWHIKQSQLYALLARLEEEALVESTIEHQGARPPRKIMRLTLAGRLAFERWVTQPVPHGRDFRQEFLAKLFFAVREGQQVARMLIEQQRVACSGWLDQLQRQEHQHAAQPNYNWLVTRFRIGQIEAALTWLDECRNALATIDL